MKYTGNIYRPPFESNSLLLQATVGCSHNDCSFCSMYHGVPFETEGIEQIEKDLLEAASVPYKYDRIFLLNADAFILSADKLKQIGQKIKDIYPSCETISMYASINNIKNKTDKELKELRQLNFNDFNIGIESGYDALIKELNKGHTSQEAKKQLLRLKNAGFNYSINIIIGGAGCENSEDHIKKSIDFINQTEPRLVFLANLHIDPGTPLFASRSKGTFKENTVRMNIQETIDLVDGIEIETELFGLHPSNIIPIHGILPNEKYKILNKLLRYEKDFPKLFLDSVPDKVGEGRAIIK
ncbi:MAG: radical SAM protein [Firmicutes bacterium]|nr:radical SAM protein [Bacillota bacterium]